MLTYLMATQDEGPDFDLFLRDLAQAMGPEDTLLVFHRGDEQTLARLQAFAEHHLTQIVQTEGPVACLGDLLRLGLQIAETKYTFPLAPTDRLQPNALVALRENLNRETPDLCVIYSAWWLADTDHPLHRSDRAFFDTLAARPAPADCAGLLPDPRRLVFQTAKWIGRSAAWPAGLEGKALYDRTLSDNTDLIAMPAPALLHLFALVNPKPALEDLHQELAARAKGDRSACLAEWAPLLDEHLSLCPPSDAQTVLRALPPIAALLPRQARRNVTHIPGPFALLLAAWIKDGDLGAKAELSLFLATQQQRRTDILASAYGRLRQDLDLALPGPDYLRALYTRLRGV